MPKGNQTGSVRRQRGWLYLRFYAPGKDGKRTPYTPALHERDTQANYAAACKLLKRIVFAIDIGDPWEHFLHGWTPPVKQGGARRNPTFAEFVEEWVPGCAQAESSRKQYAHIARGKWVPLLGDRHMSGIGPTLLDSAVATVSSDIKQNTVRSYVKTLRKVFDAAVRDGIYTAETNPARHIDMPKRGKSNRAQFAQDEAGVSEIIDRAHAMLEPFYATGFDLQWSLGLRIGELSGLQWGDIDLGRGLLFVERTGSSSRTKTERSRRTLALDGRLRSLLGEHFKARRSEWVFPAVLDAERPMAREQWQTRWTPLREALGKPYLTTHHARHSFVSRAMLDGGLRLEQIAAILGDSAQVVDKHYARILESQETVRQQLRLLDSLSSRMPDAGTIQESEVAKVG